MQTTGRLLTLLGILLLPSSSWAHVGLHGDGFTSGFAHPIFGFDHFLAMLSVGLLSVQMGGRAIWTVPTTFVLFVLVGGILGMHDVPLFTVEAGIASSVLILGLTILADRQIPVLLAMAGVAVFGLFHGHAHGTEMPADASGLAYGLGFVVATGLLHACGLGLGLALAHLSRRPAGRLTQATGTAICLAGITLLVAAVA